MCIVFIVLCNVQWIYNERGALHENQAIKKTSVWWDFPSNIYSIERYRLNLMEKLHQKNSDSALRICLMGLIDKKKQNNTACLPYKTVIFDNQQ